MTARTPVDSDFWWHLRAGEVTLNTQKPLNIDLFSYTKTGESWINHSWMGQLLLFLAYKIGSYFGVTVLVSSVAAITIGLLYSIGTSPLFFRSLIMIFGVVVMAPVWSPRPQIFSLMFLAIIVTIVNHYRTKRKTCLWTLPVVFIIWSNLHAGFSLGLIYLGCVFLGDIVELATTSQPEFAQDLKAELKSLVFIIPASALGATLNPNGFHSWMVQFNTIQNQFLQKYIVEWASPDFHDITQLPFLMLVIGTFLITGLTNEKINPRSMIIVAVFSFLGFFSRRNIGAFAIVTIPFLDRFGWLMYQSVFDLVFGKIIASNNKQYFKFWDKCQKEFPSLTNKLLNLFLVLVFIGAGFIKTQFVSNPLQVDKAIELYYPVSANAIIHQQNLKGNIFNEYNWGGYLIWNLPWTPVFVDGRTDFFGDEVIDEWSDIITAEPGWQKLIEKYQIDLVLVQPDRLIIRNLVDEGWIRLFEDEKSVLLKKNSL